MAYLLSIFCMVYSFVEKANGNVLDTGVLMLAASVFWFAGNYFYKNISKSNGQNENNVTSNETND